MNCLSTILEPVHLAGEKNKQFGGLYSTVASASDVLTRLVCLQTIFGILALMFSNMKVKNFLQELSERAKAKYKIYVIEARA